ncbi:TorF family putative porin [Altererythrobacter sp. GH1-8]|uniref:TorF family putative porin n=1 Tax=Altererythrobacter sp. GH1-8 TaxID=3349333 RepID=UPI00374DA771
MLTSIRGLSAATLAGAFALSTPALASEAEASKADVTTVLSGDVTQADYDRAMAVVDEEAASHQDSGSGFEFSGNVALVSEYRFRGVDLSGGDIAVQGGVDLAHSSGFYLGTWGSSLDEDTVGYGHTELDVYGGFGGSIGEAVSFDIGVIAYLYPNAGPGDFDYIEFYGSLGFNLGPAEATVGVAYAPDQDSLGSTDNLYLYTDIGIGIPSTPLTLTGHLGYTDGFLTFTNNSKAWDWSIGVEAAVAGPVSVGVAYVGAEGDFLPGDYDFTDDAIVFTLSASI